jgi:dTDP-4-dehydrorhamnose 3,5-epimerase
MKIIKELLPGCFVIQNQIFKDSRGSLSVPFSTNEFSKSIGQPFELSQTMYTLSEKSVLRGLHYQNHVSPISKLISCTNGSIYDVIVDLRHNSETFGQWRGIHLNEKDNIQIFAPVGIAHGFVSLITYSGVFYYQAGDYNLDASCVLSWDDCDLAIEWPVKAPILSDRDGKGISWKTYAKSPVF